MARIGAACAWLRRPPLWLTLLGCSVILVARRAEDVRNPQFWAEDGAVFFQQAWTLGWRSLLEPYAGYLCTAQRLGALAAMPFDPAWAPAIFMACAGLLTLYTAARTQSTRFPLPPHGGYALAVVLVPDAFEVLLFLVNVQWVTGAAFLLLLISRDPRRGGQWAHDLPMAGVLGLTGPFSILFAPLFAWRAWHRRTRASIILAVLVLGCALVQGWLLSKHPGNASAEPIAYEMALAAPGTRIVGSLLAGKHTFGMPPLLATALGGFVLLGVSVLAFRRGEARVERMWLALAFGAVLAASLYRCRALLPALQQPIIGARYFFAPQLIVLWLAVALLADRNRRLAGGAGLVLLWAVAINVPRLREPALADFHWAEHARTLRSGVAATVPINPAGWTFSVPAAATVKGQP